jgi:hypothetical protein
MNQQKYIQDENILVVISIAFLCVALILWTYNSDKKRNSEVDIYTKSLSWRLYLINGIVLLIMIFELFKRFKSF